MASQRRDTLWGQVLLVAACIVISVVTCIGAPVAPKFLLSWGSLGSGVGQFYYPQDVAVGRDGLIYVVDEDNHRIQVFTNDGQFVRMWGTRGTAPGQFNYPISIAFDSMGNALVTDWQNFRIQVFTAEGNFVRMWGSEGTGDGQFASSDTTQSAPAGPWGIVVDTRDNSVYVSDQGNSRIQKFSSTGVFLTKWGSWGSGDGQFHDPRGLALDSSGNLYVADGQLHRLQVFNSYGTFLRGWGTLFGDGGINGGADIAIAPGGDVQLVDAGDSNVNQYNSQGLFFQTWGAGGTDVGYFNGPDGIAYDAQGAIYVADTGNHRVQKFTGGDSPVERTTWGLIKALYR